MGCTVEPVVRRGFDVGGSNEVVVGEAAVAYAAGTALRGWEAAPLRVICEGSADYCADFADDPADVVDPKEALDALEQAVGLLARVDLGSLDDRGLLEDAVNLDRQVTRIVAQRARRLRSIDERGAYRDDACVTTASWWRWRTRRDHGEASRVVRTAQRLRWLDDTREALEAGVISPAHAEVITGAAIPRRRDAIVAHEPTLVALARTASPRAIAVACRRIAEVVDPDGSDKLAGAPDERRELYHTPTIDGLWDLRATLDPITGQRLDGLLNALAAPEAAATPEGERLSPAQRRHDAFDKLLRAAEEHDDLPAVHGATPHVLLTVDLMTLLGRDELAARPPRLASGGKLNLDRALRLLEEAKLTSVLMLGPWRAVAVGRTHRTLPPWLRPVLAMVHRHCRGPACDRPIAWADAAHLDAWYDGGATDLDRTIPACRGHHDLMDLAGWQVQLDPDTATCTWTSPDGRTVIRTHPPDP